MVGVGLRRLGVGVIAALAAVGVTVSSAAATHRVATMISVRLAALGSDVQSPRGPFVSRPHKIAFDLGGYYGAGTRGLWIQNLHWLDWGEPVAYASGTVNARVWPTKKFIVTPGGIMLDKLQSCGGNRFYYTSANMVAPAGFPQNTESTAVGMGEQALTPC